MNSRQWSARLGLLLLAAVVGLCGMFILSSHPAQLSVSFPPILLKSSPGIQ